MAMEIVVAPVLEKTGGYLVHKICRQFGYLFCYTANIKNLEGELGNMRKMRDGVKRSVHAAARNLEETGPVLEGWLIDVCEKEKEAEEVLKEARIQNGCLNGWCPNLKSRYSLSRKATKINEDIYKLQEKGKRFETPFHPAPSGGIDFVPSRDFKEFASRKTARDEIMAALTDDSFNMIGVCGMGGIGKTTMVTGIKNQVKKDLFDEVVMAVVSQQPDWKKIQNEIAEQLGFNDLKLKESEFERAGKLCERIKKEERILIILDDVWACPNLDNLGIPYGNDHRGCKILLTSRETNVFDGMEILKNIKIDILKEEESWHLFKDMAGPSVDTPDRQLTAKAIVDQCGGLPLALATIGSAIRNKPIHVWKDALRQLQMPSEETISGVHSTLYQSLKLSYDYLEFELARSCLLLCCLFPEDFYIEIEDLFGILSGLGLLVDTDMLEDSRTQVLAVIYKLKSCHLLLDTLDKETVKMHDVVRDFSISIASKKSGFMIKHHVYVKDWHTYENCTSISLVVDKIMELPEGLKLPKLEFLLLQCENRFLKVQDNFFESMKQLKVLVCLDMSFPLPPSLSVLQNLRTLILNGCYPRNISKIGELKQLEILSFRDSSIYELPKEVGGLSNLKLLDLRGCQLKRIWPGVISGFVKLEELYMRDSFTKWEAEEGQERHNPSLVELQSLSRLKVLDIRIPDPKLLPRNPMFGNLQKYNIVLGSDDFWFGDLFGNRLNLKLSRNAPLEGWIKNLLPSTETLICEGEGSNDVVNELVPNGLRQLVISECEMMTEVFLEERGDGIVIDKIEFPNLEDLRLKGLPCLTCFCKGIDKIELPQLKCLKIEGLPLLASFLGKMCNLASGSDNYSAVQSLFSKEVNLTGLNDLTLKDVGSLTEIWDGELGAGSFCELRKVSVSKCENLLSIIPSKLIKRLENLTSLEANDCESLVVVFDFEGINFEEGHELEILPHLQKIRLEYLPDLMYVWKKAPKVFQRFGDLTSLCVRQCKSLKNIFSPSMAKFLQNLEELGVTRCDAMEEIVLNDQEGKGNKDVTEAIVLPKIRNVVLNALPTLTSFCSGPYIFKWPSLVTLTLGCRKIKKFNAEQVSFPSLEELRLIGMKDRLESMTAIPLPVESLCKLKKIHVEDCRRLSNVFPSSFIPKLQYLQKLALTNCVSKEVFHLEQRDIKEGDVLFSHLTSLELKDLRALNHIWKGSPREDTHFQNLRILRVRFCDNLRYIFSAVTATSLRMLGELEVEYCKSISEIVTEQNGQGKYALDLIEFSQLNSLKLSYLKSLASFVSKVIPVASNYQTTENLKVIDPIYEEIHPNKNLQESTQPLFNEKVAFPRLETLTLSDLENLRQIWSSQLPTGLFPNLKALYVYSCHNLSNVAQCHVLQNVSNLESLHVSYCESLEEVIELEGLDDAGGVYSKPLPLQEIDLRSLPKLTHICKKIQHGILLGNLTSLLVSYCGSLRKLFSSSMARGLMNLQKLGIIGCQTMEEVVAKDEGGPQTMGRPLLPQLNSVRLDSLPRIRSFCHETCALEWPCLEEVAVSACPKMQTFSLGSINTPMLDVVGVSWKQKVWMGELNKTIQYLFSQEKEKDSTAALTEISATISLPLPSSCPRDDQLGTKVGEGANLPLESNIIQTKQDPKGQEINIPSIKQFQEEDLTAASTKFQEEDSTAASTEVSATISLPLPSSSPKEDQLETKVGESANQPLESCIIQVKQGPKGQEINIPSIGQTPTDVPSSGPTSTTTLLPSASGVSFNKSTAEDKSTENRSAESISIMIPSPKQVSESIDLIEPINENKINAQEALVIKTEGQDTPLASVSKEVLRSSALVNQPSEESPLSQAPQSVSTESTTSPSRFGPLLQDVSRLLSKLRESSSSFSLPRNISEIEQAKKNLVLLSRKPIDEVVLAENVRLMNQVLDLLKDCLYLFDSDQAQSIKNLSHGFSDMVNSWCNALQLRNDLNRLKIYTGEVTKNMEEVLRTNKIKEVELQELTKEEAELRRQRQEMEAEMEAKIAQVSGKKKKLEEEKAIRSTEIMELATFTDAHTEQLTSIDQDLVATEATFQLIRARWEAVKKPFL